MVLLCSRKRGSNFFALKTLHIYYTTQIALQSSERLNDALHPLYPVDCDLFRPGIYYTTGLPFGGTFIIQPGGKPFRGVSILPRGLQGSPLFKTPISIIPPGYHYEVLSALAALYIHYIPVIGTLKAL